MAKVIPTPGEPETRWEDAIEHFCSYLPVTHEEHLVVYDHRFHSNIVRALAERLRSTLFFDLVEGEESALLGAEEAHRDRSEVGLISFLIPDASKGIHGGFRDGVRRALSRFDAWSQTRLRVCFDVADANFAYLFSEVPNALAKRCHQVREQLAETSELTYHSNESDDHLNIETPSSAWVVYSGLEPYEYILPAGEVATLPSSVDGRLVVDGWIVGTIPFGQKYGRIHPGDLILRFDNGNISRVEGRNLTLCQDFDAVITAIPGLGHVGEVGIGQSRGAAKAASQCKVAYQWHERHVGLHLGLGAELPQTLSPHLRTCDYHLDLVLASGRLSFANRNLALSW